MERSTLPPARIEGGLDMSSVRLYLYLPSLERILLAVGERESIEALEAARERARSLSLETRGGGEELYVDTAYGRHRYSIERR